MFSGKDLDNFILMSKSYNINVEKVVSGVNL